MFGSLDRGMKKRIVHPQSMTEAVASLAKLEKLRVGGNLPETLQVFMMSTALMRIFRLMLGKSDIGVAWELLVYSLKYRIDSEILEFRMKYLGHNPCPEVEVDEE